MNTTKGTILAVDDTRQSLELLTDILTAEGYDVRSADSGELAVASVAAGPPDLILLDIFMPGMNGFEVLRRLKEQEATRDIPVICLSVTTETELLVEGFKLGAVDFVSKPFHTRELLARVQTHLELRRLRVQIEDRAVELLLANDKLQTALADIKRLSGLLPICASCKKIRDDKGYWNCVESYISEHSEAVFSHGVCPECAIIMYEELETFKMERAE